MESIYLVFKRGEYNMGNKKDKKSKNKKQHSENEDDLEDGSSTNQDDQIENNEPTVSIGKTAVSVKIPYIIIACTIANLCILLLCMIFNFNTDYVKLAENVNSLQDDYNQLQTTIDNNFSELENKIDNKFVEYKEYQEKKIESIEKDIKTLESNVYNIKTVSFNTEYQQFFALSNGVFASNPKWNNKDKVAVDLFTKDTYHADELSDQKILTSYIDKNGANVIFCGYFNNNNHWDGDCTINVYKNGKLLLITDAKYDDGNLLKYSQVLRKSNDKAWVVSDRRHADNFNSGDSWEYTKTKNCSLNFNIDNLKMSNVLDVKKFKSQYCKILECFYHGNTSNGSYNDNTGKSYYVKYSKNGKVDILYIGNFKNGVFDDDTGNAKEIVYDTYKNMNKYFYFKGKFKDNVRQGNVNETNYISQEQIDEILDGMKFNCELEWHKTKK